MLRGAANTRGDTLIEVLFAITVFSLVVVTSLAIMNQGTQAALRSLQLTLVRQQVDSQAEALRFFEYFVYCGIFTWLNCSYCFGASKGICTST